MDPGDQQVCTRRFLLLLPMDEAVLAVLWRFVRGRASYSLRSAILGRPSLSRTRAVRRFQTSPPPARASARDSV